jgi:uncharacterized caspase-like protein
MCPIGLGTSHFTPIATDEAKLWLLLVGVDNYNDDRLSTLHYCASDCQGVSEALLDTTQIFSQKEIHLYHDASACKPNIAKVRSSLQRISAIAKPQDTVLLYFSGHGVLESKSQQPVLCLSDTQTDDLLATGLSMSELLECLGNCRASQQLVWLDACHSGAMKWQETKNDAAQQTQIAPQLIEGLRQCALRSRSFYAFLSCDRNQKSWEFPQLKHGVFSYFLMRGLRGEAADDRGVIEADRLYRYVYYQTLQYIDNTNQQLRLMNQQKRSRGETQLHLEYPLQTPKRIVEGVGEFILGKKPQPMACASC